MLPCLSLIITLLTVATSTQALPEQIRGVNVGNLFIFERWMAPKEWAQMGGEQCDDDCGSCAATEYTLTKKLGQKQADKVFEEHWSTWFTQEDVDLMVNYGLNAVRMPIGWWIIEELKGDQDHFPGGQLPYLKRALRMLKEAGIAVLLDIHANPGVQAANQMFTGWCRSEAHFYEPENYIKDVRASAVLASLIHADPDFSTVFGLQAVNEPEVDPNNTPGLLPFYDDFVEAVRAVEKWHGMDCSEHAEITDGLEQETKDLIKSYWAKVGVSPPVHDGTKGHTGNAPQAGSNECISTTFMASAWQYYNGDANEPSTIANGNILYDQHLYYSFGGVANATEEAYMLDVCNSSRYETSELYNGEDPDLAFFGEWWIATEWTPDVDEERNQTHNAFYRDFGDAQKLTYNKGRGWFFWSWKLEAETEFAYTRDYRQAVAQGILTANPSAFFNPEVCQDFLEGLESDDASDSISIPELGSTSAAASSGTASASYALDSATASASNVLDSSKPSGPARMTKSSPATDLSEASPSVGAIPLASDGLLRWV